jgi:hypothetical protein
VSKLHLAIVENRERERKREREKERERERERERANKQGISCITSFDMGLTSAEAHKLDCLK